MSGNQDSKEDELGKKGDGEEEEDLEVGRSSTDKLRGSGVDEKALDDVGTGKGKEIVIQTRARDDEASGEFKMKEGLGDEEIALVLLTRKAINSHQLALEIVQRLMREKGPAGVKMILSSVATFLKTKGTEEVIIVSAGEVRLLDMCCLGPSLGPYEGPHLGPFNARNTRKAVLLPPPPRPCLLTPLPASPCYRISDF